MKAHSSTPLLSSCFFRQWIADAGDIKASLVSLGCSQQRSSAVGFIALMMLTSDAKQRCVINAMRGF